MRYRRLGMSGIEVSEFCLGAMNFGHPSFGIDEATSAKIINAFLAAGGNFIDTADAYAGGISEQIIARALGDRRDSVILATKGFFPRTPEFGMRPEHVNAHGATRRHLTQALHDSLRRLNTDYVDLYQVHCWDPKTPIEETLSTLSDFIRSGKVRYVGLSNYTAWQIAESRQLCKHFGWEPFITAQMQYSLVCRHIEQDVIPVCQRYGMGLLPWSPLGMGVLTGKYSSTSSGPAGSRFGKPPKDEDAAAWRANFINERSLAIAEVVKSIAGRLETTATAVSLAWLLRQPVIASVIIGPKNIEQLEQNLAAAEVELSDEHVAKLDEASTPPPRYPEAFVTWTQRAQ
jgi:aryl-alcohol dehydrogenase-like predicted oxidoreductase